MKTTLIVIQNDADHAQAKALIEKEAQNAPARRAPYDVFRQLELGSGGYVRAAAKDAKIAGRAAIARKHGK